MKKNALIARLLYSSDEYKAHAKASCQDGLNCQKTLYFIRQNSNTWPWNTALLLACCNKLTRAHTLKYLWRAHTHKHGSTHQEKLSCFLYTYFPTTLLAPLFSSPNVLYQLGKEMESLLVLAPRLVLLHIKIQICSKSFINKIIVHRNFPNYQIII